MTTLSANRLPPPARHSTVYCVASTNADRDGDHGKNAGRAEHGRTPRRVSRIKPTRVCARLRQPALKSAASTQQCGAEPQAAARRSVEAEFLQRFQFGRQCSGRLTEISMVGRRRSAGACVVVAHRIAMNGNLCSPGVASGKQGCPDSGGAWCKRAWVVGPSEYRIRFTGFLKRGGA